MQRVLSTERLFKTGDFANIKFSHTLTDIPEGIALDPEAMRQLEYLQLLDVEYSHKKYYQLLKQEDAFGGDVDQILGYIETEQIETFKQFINHISAPGE